MSRIYRPECLRPNGFSVIHGARCHVSVVSGNGGVAWPQPISMNPETHPLRTSVRRFWPHNGEKPPEPAMRGVTVRPCRRARRPGTIPPPECIRGVPADGSGSMVRGRRMRMGTAWRRYRAAMPWQGTRGETKGEGKPAVPLDGSVRTR